MTKLQRTKTQIAEKKNKMKHQGDIQNRLDSNTKKILSANS